jgi:hypothetical protein
MGGVNGQHHAPAALYLRGKDPQYPLDRRLGGPHSQVWTQGLEEKSSAPVGDQTPIVQPIVRHYTAWATAAPVLTLCQGKYSLVLFAANLYTVTEKKLLIPTENGNLLIISVTGHWQVVEFKMKTKKTFCFFLLCTCSKNSKAQVRVLKWVGESVARPIYGKLGGSFPLSSTDWNIRKLFYINLLDFCTIDLCILKFKSVFIFPLLFLVLFFHQFWVKYY